MDQSQSGMRTEGTMEKMDGKALSLHIELFHVEKPLKDHYE